MVVFHLKRVWHRWLREFGVQNKYWRVGRFCLLFIPVLVFMKHNYHAWIHLRTHRRIALLERNEFCLRNARKHYTFLCNFMLSLVIPFVSSSVQYFCLRYCDRTTVCWNLNYRKRLKWIITWALHSFRIWLFIYLFILSDSSTKLINNFHAHSHSRCHKHQLTLIRCLEFHRKFVECFAPAEIMELCLLLLLTVYNDNKE